MQKREGESEILIKEDEDKKKEFEIR